MATSKNLYESYRSTGILILTRVRLPCSGLPVREHGALETAHDVHDDRLDRRLKYFLLGTKCGEDIVKGVTRFQLFAAFSLYDGYGSFLSLGSDDRQRAVSLLVVVHGAESDHDLDSGAPSTRYGRGGDPWVAGTAFGRRHGGGGAWSGVRHGRGVE